MPVLGFRRMLAVWMATATWMLGAAAQAEPARPECVAPAQPGGGFDLTCRLAQTALADSGALKTPHVIDDSMCVRCGLCLKSCPVKAISVE